MFKDVLARQQEEETLRTVVAVTVCTLIALPFVLAAKLALNAFQFGCRVADRTIIAVMTFL